MNSNENSRPEGTIILAGIFYSNLIGFVIIGLSRLILHLNKDAGEIFLFSDFVLVPVLMGIISVKFWIHLKRKLPFLILLCIPNTLLACLLSVVFLQEGVLCLLIVSPLLLSFMIVGLVIGKQIYKDKNTTLKASTAFIFLVLFIFDTFSVHNYTNMVSDEITINASKEKVWKYVAAHPVNNENPEYWLFRVGLPNPVQSTVSAYCKGANRKCIFSNNAVFEETMVEYYKDSLLTFDIDKQPEDPEIIGHIDIQRGQFILKENKDGSTTLIGNSWYRLMVYPVWYYDIWAEDITREVHKRAMKHIKKLAEKDV
jgi:hypothetical protein